MKKIILVSILMLLLTSCGKINNEKTNDITEVKDSKVVTDVNTEEEVITKEKTADESVNPGSLLEDTAAIQDNTEEATGSLTKEEIKMEEERIAMEKEQEAKMEEENKKLEAKMEEERLAMEKEQEAKMEEERIAMEAEAEKEAKAMEAKIEKEAENNK